MVNLEVLAKTYADFPHSVDFIASEPHLAMQLVESYRRRANDTQPSHGQIMRALFALRKRGLVQSGRMTGSQLPQNLDRLQAARIDMLQRFVGQTCKIVQAPFDPRKHPHPDFWSIPLPEYGVVLLHERVVESTPTGG